MFGGSMEDIKNEVIEEVKVDEIQQLAHEITKNRIEMLLRKEDVKRAAIELKHLEAKMKFLRECEIPILLQKVTEMKNQFDIMDKQIRKIIMSDNTKIKK
jgi:hypothetical protein